MILILLFAFFLFFVWASADIKSNIYLRTKCKGKTKEKVVVLTFDDGPDELMTPKVLDILKRYNIKATFFLVGSKVDKYPHVVKRIFDEGHVVANHTYSHNGLFPLSNIDDVIRDISKCSDSVYDAIGLYPKLFRPPFGVTNPIIAKAVNKKGLTTIGWSIRSFDTMEWKSRMNICNRVEKKLHSGAIILLHDRCLDSDILLKKIIPLAFKKGYSFISLEEMLEIDVYEN